MTAAVRVRQVQALCKVCVTLPYVQPGEKFDRDKHRPKKDRLAPHPGPRCDVHHRVCKVCAELPYPEPGEEFDKTKHRPRVDRPAPHSGPRCETHRRAKKVADSIKEHGRRVATVYGITVEFYWELYEFQGGKCYICERAYGRKKRLAVDHNHNCTAGHPEENACELCVRGLLCTMCNRKIVGHLRDDPEAFRRGAEYLENPPARRLRETYAA